MPATTTEELKTENSRRTLALSRVCLDALRRHRTKQLGERRKADAAWRETGLVFVTYKRSRGKRTIGTALHPRNVLRVLHGLLKAADVPRVRFHDLRHSAASLLIAAGVPLVEVSMLLGHSELRVTADLHSHLQQETPRRRRSTWMLCRKTARASTWASEVDGLKSIASETA